MSAHQAQFRIATMARVLGVSTSGYYAWRRRPPPARAQADADLTARVEEIHTRSRGPYGAPRIHAELAESDVPVSRKRVARVMRAAGIAGVSRRREPRTTRRDTQARPAPDRVERHFEADAPNRLWVADITYVPTLVGFLYLAIVLDVFSRRVVGWAMATHLRTELVIEALEMAVAQRRPEAVVHHSDQGCQYTSLAFGARCRTGAWRCRWARWAIALTRRWPRASSRRSSASCSTVPTRVVTGVLLEHTEGMMICRHTARLRLRKADSCCETCRLDDKTTAGLLGRRASFGPGGRRRRHRMLEPCTVSPRAAVEVLGLGTPGQRRAEPGGRRGGRPRSVGNLAGDRYRPCLRRGREIPTLPQRSSSIANTEDQGPVMMWIRKR